MRLQTKQNPGTLVFCICLLLAAGGCGSRQPASAETTAQASRAISLATQVASNLRATREAESAQAEATRQAIESLLLQAEQWPVVIEDKFDHNELEWPIGNGDDPLATIHWEIRDGQYHWQTVANEPFVWWTTPNIDSYSNFFLGVDLLQLAGPADAEAGLVFRLSDGDYYLFEINGSQQYSFYLHIQNDWESIQEWTDSELIAIDNPNRLSVIANREDFHLLINHHYLASLTDIRLAGGSAGVLAGLSNPGDEGSWAFDNFTLQAQDLTAP